MALTVRRGGPADSELITRLHAATAQVAYAHIFRDAPFPVEMTMRRWEAFDGEVLIAEEEQRAIGFVAYAGEELSALYVVPECWGRGAGGLLLDLAGPVTSLWVLEANALGRRFYERRGWASDGALREAFGVTELHYRRAATRS